MNAHATSTATPIVITQYDELKAQVRELAEASKAKVFKYEDPKENKLARSHVYALRQTKGQVEKVRVAAKADALEYGRKVDAIAKELTAEVEAMIAVHQAPLDAIEAKEEARKTKHQAVIARIVGARDTTGMPASEIAKRLDGLRGYSLDAMEEFATAATQEMQATIAVVEKALAAQTAKEAEAAELARLRAEQAKREQAEREEQIRQEAVAAEKARADEIRRRELADAEIAKLRAEAAAKAEAERVEREAKERIAAVERQAAEAKAAADREVARINAENKAREDARLAEETRRKVAEEMAARDKARREKVHNAIHDSIVGLQTDEIVDAIAAGRVPHVSIVYGAA